MPVISLPWPYTPGVGPTYSADDWANVWSWLGYHDGRSKQHTGVLGGRGSFVCMNAGFPTILVWPGAALVGGRFVEITENSMLSVSPAHPTYKRIDLLVLRTNATAQNAELAIREGTPGPAPVAPAPVQDGNPLYELPLYELHVRAGAISWNGGTDFVDVRRFSVDPATVLLDVWLNYPTLPTVEAGAPVFASNVRPYGVTDSFPFMPVGLVNGSEVTASTPLLGVAAERTVDRRILPVICRGFVAIRLTEAVTAGEMVVVAIRNDNTMTVGRAPVYNVVNRVTWWRPLGTALTSAGAGEQGLVWVDPLTLQAAPREWSTDRLAQPSDYSTTSTSWVNVPNMSLSDLVVRSPLVAVSVTGQAKHSVAGGECTLSLLLDNYTSPISLYELGHHQLSAANRWQNISADLVIDWAQFCYEQSPVSAPADPHTLQLRVKTNTGTLTLRSMIQFRVRETTTGA